MKTLNLAVMIVLFTLVDFAFAQAVNPDVNIRYDATLGHYLAGANGMTLYIFTRDEEGQSNCYDQCAVNWPPLLVEGESVAFSPLAIPGALGVTERTDGTMQATYNGMPLYYWLNDQNPGDVTGQGVGDVWYVANLNPLVQVLYDDELGDILVGPTGMTLYLFTPDEENVTNCYEGCANRWPPLMTSSADHVLAGEGIMAEFELGTIARDDGGLQVTYNGIPLYYWIRDHNPGDTNGQNVGDVWFVINP